MKANTPTALPPTKPASRFEQDFSKVELLGRGGFGEVWRAHSRVDRKDYAIKVVPFSYDLGGDPLEHPILREAQAWAALRHPNVVGYHTAWVEVEGESEPIAGADNGPSLAAPQVRGVLPAGARTGDHLAKSNPWDVSSGASTEDEGVQGQDVSDEGVIFESTSSGGVAFESSMSTHAKESDAECDAERNAERLTAPAAQQGHMQIMPMKSESAKSIKTVRAKLFLQLEFVRDGTLRDWIDERNANLASGTQVSPISELHIFSQLVDVVAHLHCQGLVHRDIKPANILLTENGGIRLGDFGLLKATGAAPPLQQAAVHVGDSAICPVVSVASAASPEPALGGTRPSNRGVGTPSYASPEQFQGRQHGVEADIYALGMVLTELFCPVATQMERAILFEGLRVERRLPATAEAVDPQVAAHVLKMTSPDPRERPSAKDLQTFVHQYALRHGVQTCRVQPDPGEVGYNMSVCMEPLRIETAEDEINTWREKLVTAI